MKEIRVDRVSLEKNGPNGDFFLTADVMVGEGPKPTGARLAFKLKEHPNLEALLPIIQGEIANSVRASFGVKLSRETDA